MPLPAVLCRGPRALLVVFLKRKLASLRRRSEPLAQGDMPSKRASD